MVKLDAKTDLASISEVVSYAFNKAEPVAFNELFLERLAHSQTFGHKSAEKLTSVVMNTPFTMQYFKQTLKMGGIGYVASLPEYRGQGSIAALLQEAFQTMHHDQVVISNLAPFSERFYRRFGYENTIYQKHYVISSQAFLKFTSETTGEIVRSDWQNEVTCQAVFDFHQKQLKMGGEAGTINRERWWWQRRAHYTKNQSVVLVKDDKKQVTGYMSYARVGTIFQVLELAYTTNQSIRQLLTFMKSHTSAFQTFQYAGGLHEKLAAFFSESSEITVTTKPYMMSRIIDFAQLLKQTPLLKEVDDLVLEVTDDSYCPWNTGKWLVSSNPEISGMTEYNTVMQTTRKSHLTGSIQGFAALLLGQITVQEGVLLGYFQAEDPDFLQNLFPKGQISFYDYF